MTQLTTLLEQIQSLPQEHRETEDFVVICITKDNVAVHAQLSETGKVHAAQGCMYVFEALIEDGEPTEDAVH